MNKVARMSLALVFLTIPLAVGLGAQVPTCALRTAGQACLGPLGISGGIDNTVTSVSIFQKQAAQITLSVSGTNPPYIWNIVGGSLPVGFQSPIAGTKGQELILSGTPTGSNVNSQTYTFTVQVIDALGDSYSGSLSIIVFGATPPSTGTGCSVPVTAIDPASAPAGGPGFTLTMYGDFNALGTVACAELLGEEGLYLKWDPNPAALCGSGQPTCGLTIQNNGTNVTAFIPADYLSTPGVNYVTVNANNYSGVYFGGLPFTIYSTGASAPTITSLSPASAIDGSAFQVTVSGTNFSPGATVFWNLGGLPTTFLSSTQLIASVNTTSTATYASLPGPQSVTVSSGGQFAAPVNFGLNAVGSAAGPAISGLSPASATVGGSAFTLTVNGSNLAAGASVLWNGSALSNTTYISSTQLTAQVSSNLIASAGTVSITVSSGGQVSAPVSFGISQSTGGSGPTVVSDYTSTVDGIVSNSCTSPAATSAFTTSSPAVWLYFGISGVVSTDTTQIKWVEPNGTVYETENSTAGFAGTGCFAFHINVSGASAAAIPGTWSVQALWDQSSTPLFTVTFSIGGASPVITGLSPSLATAGGPAFTLSVNGSGFVLGDAVDWNGAALATNFVSSAQLAASVPASLIASSATASVTVSGGGQASGAVSFTIAVNTSNTQTISHIADGSGWRSGILLVNNDSVPAPYTVSFWNGTGVSYTPTLATGTSSGTIPVGGSTVIETADANPDMLTEGWAQVASSRSLGGTAIFRYDPWSQEAAVPLLTSGGTSLAIPYQVGNGLALGVALANPSAAQTATVTETIRDQNGNQLSTRNLALAPLSHSAFNPPGLANLIGAGVVEYGTGASLFALGIRNNGEAFTSVDAILPQAASGKTVSHVADGAGWRSVIILVNTDTVPASYAVSFLTDSGASYTPSLAAGALSGTIPIGGSTIIETADSNPNLLTEGWAQIASNQSLGGTAIFRYEPWSQEAAVPLLTSGGTSLEIPYQVGNGLALGVALANPSATQTADITEIIRDQNGNQLSTRTFTLTALSHSAFNPPGLNNLTGSGVVEYDANINIFALGIRSASQAFTSVRAVYK